MTPDLPPRAHAEWIERVDSVCRQAPPGVTIFLPARKLDTAELGLDERHLHDLSRPTFGRTWCTVNRDVPGLMEAPRIINVYPASFDGIISYDYEKIPTSDFRKFPSVAILGQVGDPEHSRHTECGVDVATVVATAYAAKIWALYRCAYYDSQGRFPNRLTDNDNKTWMIPENYLLYLGYDRFESFLAEKERTWQAIESFIQRRGCIPILDPIPVDPAPFSRYVESREHAREVRKRLMKRLHRTVQRGKNFDYRRYFAFSQSVLQEMERSDSGSGSSPAGGTSLSQRPEAREVSRHFSGSSNGRRDGQSRSSRDSSRNHPR